MRYRFDPEVVRHTVKQLNRDDLETLYIDALVRVDALEEAIQDALRPGRYGWELLNADEMADRLTDTYDPFQQDVGMGCELSAYEQAAQKERAALAAWNAGTPIQGMHPPGYYVINP